MTRRRAAALAAAAAACTALLTACEPSGSAAPAPSGGPASVAPVPSDLSRIVDDAESAAARADADAARGDG
ncbi:MULTISPECIES: hypothetical protein [unclassified Streptomyces]|uniref:hypothetical protein n=1 Tax=unclassified Streptomyces TaxID=2593676 RepID=UPI0038270E3E